MIFRALIASFLLLSAPAGAQGVPRLNEAVGFSVVGVLDGGRLVVHNDRHNFVCDVSEKDSAVMVLTDCRVILGPTAAARAQFSGLAAQRDEGMFLDLLADMPVTSFVPAIEATFREFGCSVDLAASEDVFLTRMATTVAVTFGYLAPLSDAAVGEIADITDAAGALMDQQGRLVVDETSDLVRLVPC